MTDGSLTQLNLKWIGSPAVCWASYSIVVAGGVTSFRYSSAPWISPKLPSANSIVESWPSLTIRLGTGGLPVGLQLEPCPPCVPGPPKHGWKPTGVRVIAPVVGLTEIRCAPASNEYATMPRLYQFSS